jgi:glycosyltransferase involved in cell wall biosynthesis
MAATVRDAKASEGGAFSVGDSDRASRSLIRIACNIALTRGLPPGVSVDRVELDALDGPLDYLRRSKALANYDVALIFNPHRAHAALAWLARHVWRCRTRIVFYDALLHAPQTRASRLRARLHALLLTSVDIFVCNHRDTAGYEREFRIARRKFRYVPFKANSYEVRDRYEVQDGDYLLAFGTSYRDYDTLVSAVRNVRVNTRILLPPDDVARWHHTVFDAANLDPHITVVRHDFDPDTLYKQIAGARLVVVPIKAGTIQSAGISAYLEAMALGKPVIVTEGVATRGILDASQAMIVPPASAGALAEAIDCLWNDSARRRELAANGRLYAHSLKGKEQLVYNLLACVQTYVLRG